MKVQIFLILILDKINKNMKLNNHDNYESVKISLDPIKTPIAYENRVKSLLDSGMSESEAKKCALEPIEVEMYFDQNAGLFLVESEAVESGSICNPYSGELMEDY